MAGSLDGFMHGRVGFAKVQHALLTVRHDKDGLK